MCEDKTVIMLILQSYVLNWYHTYLLHPGLEITEATIFQNFYLNVVRNAVRKEVSNFDTCQHTKRSNRKYGKCLAKLAEKYHRINFV